MNIYYTFMQNILYIIHARVVCRGGLLLLVVVGSGKRLERIGRRGIKGSLFQGGAAPATTCRKEKGYACRLNKIDYVDSHNE